MYNSTEKAKQMLKIYERVNSTKNYIFVVSRNGNKIACYLKNMQNIADFMEFDKHRNSLRFRPRKLDIIKIIERASKIETLASVEGFEREAARKIPNANGKPTKYNRGETAERMIFERNGQTWRKDDRRQWHSGDYIDENGTSWQIKEEHNATFCYEGEFMNQGWM